MKKSQIVISVYGGVVQDVFSAIADVAIVLVDWDIEESDPADRGIVRLTWDGRDCLVHVSQFAAEPIESMAGTDVGNAIRVALTQPAAPDVAVDHCECEEPGVFQCGVPGILAQIQNGRLAPDATVERCDLCQRYPTDEAALAKLRELGMV
jgi:hypothetical protein